jgi:hypothetical protein
VRRSTSGKYYEEVWIMPEGNRSLSGTALGVGPGLCGVWGLCGLLRTELALREQGY